MAYGSNPRNGHRYREWRRRVIASADLCVHCGRELDKTSPHRDPETGRVNPRSATADHIVPISRGGALLDPANGQASCHECNSRRGAGLLEPLPLITSEDW